MYKNFTASQLGMSGRQSELIEMALTYAFRGMDVDMIDILKRTQRSSFEEASKYLRAADIQIGGFLTGVDLDADDETFTSQVGQLHPLSEVAEKLEATQAVINLPPATDRLPYHEYFETIRDRLAQIGGVLAPHNIRLAVALNASAGAAEGKEFAFVRNVEGLIALIKAVPAENVGYLIDSWHWFVGGGTLSDLDAIEAHRIVSIRLADLPSNISPAEANLPDRVIPSLEGQIDQVGLIRWLAEHGFEGPVSPCSSAAKAKGKTRESIVGRAQEAIDAIFREAGLTVAPRPMDLVASMPYESMDNE